MCKSCWPIHLTSTSSNDKFMNQRQVHETEPMSGCFEINCPGCTDKFDSEHSVCIRHVVSELFLCQRGLADPCCFCHAVLGLRDVPGRPLGMRCGIGPAGQDCC